MANEIKKIKVGTTDFDVVDANGRKEAYLEWGGKNFSGAYGPIDAAMVPDLSANRFAFLKNVATSVTIEYSRDGGTTWTDYGATADQKSNLFNGLGASFTIGKPDSGTVATNQYQLRVSVLTANDQGCTYTSLNKFIAFVATNGTNNNWVTIRGRLQSNYESSTDTWTVFATKIPISGWSGYNVINTSNITTYGNSKAAQYGQLQFIFGCNTGSTSTYQGLNIQKIFAYGGMGWTTPSNMAKTGHIYTFDANQNTTFPAKVTATQIIKSGGTASQFLKANGTVDSNAYIYQADRGLSIVSSKVGHSNTAITAQTTQAVYPIKIDTYGHITSYGSAVTIPTVNNGKLSIKGNGTVATEFTANQGTDVALNIKGTGATTVTKSATNEITVNSTDTTYESKAAASGGTAVSLCTTGEKYDWNKVALEGVYFEEIIEGFTVIITDPRNDAPAAIYDGTSTSGTLLGYTTMEAKTVIVSSGHLYMETSGSWNPAISVTGGVTITSGDGLYGNTALFDVSADGTISASTKE